MFNFWTFASQLRPVNLFVRHKIINAMMAPSGCWKCLSRASMTSSSQLLSRSLTQPSNSVTFSTSAREFAGGKPAPGMDKISKNMKARDATRGGGTLRIKKKAIVKTGKPPAAGERKAIRKRIILSNTNALEVDGLVNMTNELLVDDGTVGKVLGLPGSVVDGLRASEAFKTTQGWGLFRRPALLVRKESVETSRMLESSEKEKSVAKCVIDGERASGKSLMLIHAMATAFLRGWIVFNIPEAQELTNAVTEYSPIPGTLPILYSQNTYTAAWLGQIGKANNSVLQELKVSLQHKLPIPLQADMSLARLCELGARDPELSWPIFQAFWSEVTSVGRPPILMALDSLSHVMQNSAYRSPDFELVHAHDLAIIRHFVGHLSGTAKLPNGGAVIAATSRSHAPISVAMDLVIAQLEDRQAGREITKRDPFEKRYDPRVEETLQNVSVMRLKGLSKLEARGLMEYWAASGVMRSRVDEKSVAEKWALAGNGIIGEIERGALWMRI